MYKPIFFQFLLILLLYSLGLSCCSNGNNTNKDKAEKKTAEVEYTLPEIPIMLTSPEERAEYVIENYWINFNFKDTMIVHQPKVTEQAFADYINLLPNVSQEKIESSIRKTIQLCEGDSIVRNYISGLFDKYLNDPNSPFRNEKLYISVLHNIISSEKFSELEKIRPKSQLKNLSKNQVGTVANDFTYTLPSGNFGKMHQISAEYLLLYFYNPECHTCKEIQQAIESSAILTKLQSDKRLRIFAMYIDENTTEWQKYAQYLPKIWMNGHNEHLRQDKKYYIPAMPTMYLLDKNKKVLLKDATVIQIAGYLVSK